MFTIRDYLPGDFEELLTLDQLCFAAGIAYDREELQFYLSRKRSVRLVAERKGNADRQHQLQLEDGPSIAGFLVANLSRTGTAHIITIDVHPLARRSGLATKLMHVAEQRMRAENCNAILLEVAVDNLAAICFYKQRGFAILKTLPRYYHNSLDGLLLGKRLDHP